MSGCTQSRVLWWKEVRRDCGQPHERFDWTKSFPPGVPVSSRVSTKIQQLLNTLKRPKRPPLKEFFVDDFEEIVEGNSPESWLSLLVCVSTQTRTEPQSLMPVVFEVDSDRFTPCSPSSLCGWSGRDPLLDVIRCSLSGLGTKLLTRT